MVRDDINKQVDSDPELKNAKGQIFMDISAEGLRIQVVDEKQYADEFSLPLHTGRCLTAAAVLLLPLFDCCQFELARRSTPAAV